MKKSEPAMHRQSGLTLLEMIVVLMIASMALALGYQSLTQWSRAETSIASTGEALRQERLTQSWFEASVRGLMALTNGTFKGEATGFGGMTSRPVLATQGGTTETTWSIKTAAGRSELVLTEDGRELHVPMRETDRARFMYFDKAGKPSDQWPPALGLADHLPASIALIRESDASQRQRVWIATVSGPRNPSDLRDLFEPEQD